MKKNSEHTTLKRKTSRRIRRKITTEETSIEDGIGGDEKDKLVYKKQQLIITCEKFAKAVVKKHIDGLRAEFEAIKAEKPDGPISVYLNNKPRNRYPDITCFDKTRVILKSTGSVDNDYIHANHVTSTTCNLRSRFICTQGPLDSTCQDFWKMVIQENVRHIVMLCKVIENNRPKCAQYFPNGIGDSKSFGNITITNIGEKANVDIGKHFQTFELLVTTGSAQDYRVCHYRCVDWPDFGVPETAIGILRVLREVRREKTPCVVHCSAGVGRTGTLMAIEIGIKHLLEKKDVNVKEIVREIRSQRAHSVQTEGQYLFIYRSILEFVKAKKHMKEVEDFFKVYADYIQGGKPGVPQQPPPPPPVTTPPVQPPQNVTTPAQDVSIQQQMPDQNPSIK